MTKSRPETSASLTLLEFLTISMETKKYVNVQLARDAFQRGENVTQFLRKQIGSQSNTSEIIEIAYDLQAGSYIEYVNKHRDSAEMYAKELAQRLSASLSDGDTLLDIGSGELTTLSLVVSKIAVSLKNIYAFDISWSRVWKGLPFARAEMGSEFHRFFAFVGDMTAIAMPSKSIDVVTSSHALEPNGGREIELLTELFRVARKKLVLFEPCYEINTAEGKERMERLGYIRNLAETAERLGGKILATTRVEASINPLNPTVCFEIEPPSSTGRISLPSPMAYAIPKTDEPLELRDGFLFSNRMGLAFPIIEGIPILRTNAAILVTALAK